MKEIRVMNFVGSSRCDDNIGCHSIESYMSEQVDLSQLAVNRGPDTSSKGIAPKRRWGSRYVLPLVVLLGFSGLIGWAAKDSR